MMQKLHMFCRPHLFPSLLSHKSLKCGRDVFWPPHFIALLQCTNRASMQRMKSSIIVLLVFCLVHGEECRAPAQTTRPFINWFRMLPMKFFFFQSFSRDAWARLSLRRLLHEGRSEVYENLPLLLLLRQVLLHLLPQRPRSRPPGEGRRAVGLQGRVMFKNLVI